MLKKFTCSLLTLLCSFTICFAQSPLAKIEFSEAETDFQNRNYNSSLEHLETVKEMLGSTNSTVMYLEILNRDKIYKMENQNSIVSRQSPLYSQQVSSSSSMGAAMSMIVSMGQTSSQSDALSRVPQSNSSGSGIDNSTLQGSLTERVKNIRLIDELSSQYVKNFEESAPIEKLTDIYNINKEYKSLNVGIEDLLAGAQALELQDFSRAKAQLDQSCSDGNAIACDMVRIADTRLAKQAEVAAVIRSIADEMILVEGGSFEMGGETTRKADEDPSLPVHEVRVRDFQIGIYEVTFEQYLAVVNPDRVGQAVRNKRIAVSGISHDIAMGFISKLNDLTGLNYRLPTEAEWEYAARGGRQGSANEDNSGDDGIFSAGNRFYKSLMKRRDRDEPATIGQEDPNVLGIYDMTGNLYEWCKDYYDPDYYEVAPLDNPEGPTSGTENVLRGGSFDSKSKQRSVDVRNSAKPGLAGSDFGLRLVLDRR
ncbi:Formylglycine-generating enzyme, required for sulfatase activity, contains SUMF1/FGE domain [Nonlabens sp. Hel1_33_55]|uniref:formylglycine-generating enzyme family protein n=1 Tax=Nonlabens sp. Hel1_33_55 TaxID=1336802 RepID=UPI000875D442|nr:SUMF1/EgtB/PvdO family nonheme iron enzyme [Nonlabens sp. Hel1_33_55]SCX98519.1 Formylglycine-generating enzyme, required for sulfatase activity, contains SUMF1/FGE domain [Nonlabens sp. Hel1_33_55]